MSEIKQVIIMRKDLNMRKGKLVSQGAHASLNAILPYISNPLGFDLSKTSLIQSWMQSNYTKICVSVDSEDELLEIYEQAKLKGLVCSIVTDLGFTEFHGVPTITCCAIGPDYASEINPITSHLKLL